MPLYVSAKEFRQRFPEIVEDLKRAGEIIVLKRSKPLFKVVPFEEIPSDLLNRAAAVQDAGGRSGNEFAVAKYYTTEAAQRAAKMAVDIHGGYGCMEEYAVTRYLRDSYVLGPSAGTSDIMKVIVSRWVLS